MCHGATIPVGADSIHIVEDDADQIYLPAELLRFEGYDVSTTRSGEEWLAALRGRRFAVVLSDHRMPGKTGGATQAEARAADLLTGTGVLKMRGSPPRHRPAQAGDRPGRPEDRLTETSDRSSRD